MQPVFTPDNIMLWNPAAGDTDAKDGRKPIEQSIDLPLGKAVIAQHSSHQDLAIYVAVHVEGPA